MAMIRQSLAGELLEAYSLRLCVYNDSERPGGCYLGGSLRATSVISHANTEALCGQQY